MNFCYCFLRRRHYVILLVMALLAGCAGQVQVKSGWQANAERDQRFERVLVIGLSENAGVRCDFESFMTTQLRRTIEAKPSCLLMKLTEPVTRESIERVSDGYQPDAVLTTSLAQSAVGTKDGGGRDTRGAGYYKATGTGYAYPYYGGYGAWGVPVVYADFKVAPVVTNLEGEVSILSMMYATEDASLVYELTTTAKNLVSRDNALATLTEPIAARLRRDGVVKE